MENKHELDSLKGERNYKGVLVRRNTYGWELWGTTYISPDEVDLAIQNATSILSESIANRNDGSINCQND